VDANNNAGDNIYIKELKAVKLEESKPIKIFEINLPEMKKP
jgi:hypothetical protein